MPEIGQMLSHFKIVKKIGQGGMGEVYLADDTTLDRKVALKFLPEAFTSDPERMARFEREAKLLASLNHSNIAGIYGLEQADGIRFLVLEYVEGETLQARLSKGALLLEDALALCRQIAEGLEAAHEKGVIHRDLKPANVMITAEEKVKILDFGLAKALSDETQSIDFSQSPTLTEAMTRPGVILGTAAYMSPEQAKGKSVDKRADIWAFGCILYECLTGKRVFEGETVTETLAAVIRGEPDIDKTPVKARQLLQQCLAKDRMNRLRDIGDAMALLNLTSGVVTSNHARRPWVAWSVAVLAVLFALVLTFLYFHDRERKEVKIFPLSIPSLPNNIGDAISPDGKWIAFVASSSESEQSLFVYATGSGTSRKLEGTEGAEYPFWSPDSRYIGFFAEGKLEKVERTGESPPRRICDVSDPPDNGTWNDEGVILFADIPELRKVSEDGGEPITIISPEEFPDTSAYGSPYFLPDGRHYLFATWTGMATKNVIYLGSLDSNEKIPIIHGSLEAVYAEPGYIIFQREGRLIAQEFDVKKFRPVGKTHNIADSVFLATGLSYLSVSEDGVLIYRSETKQAQSQFIWFDRDGKEMGTAGPPRRYRTFWDLSRDGTRLLVVQDDPVLKQPRIWLLEWKRDVFRPLIMTNVPASLFPVWSPDGDRFAYSQVVEGSKFDIFLKKIDDPGGGESIVHSPAQNLVKDWSKNDKYIAFSSDDGTSQDLYVCPVSGDREPWLIVQRPSNQDQPEFSYDGKWIAYSSNESGTWEIYIISFDEENQKWRQISTDGGVQPQWRDDDKELYYLDLNGILRAVDINLDAGIQSGYPRKLFDTKLFVEPTETQYAATPDGKRFLVLKPLAESQSIPMKLVQNWTSLLDK